jgi:hypothetical protein
MDLRIRTITIESDGETNRVFLDRGFLGAYRTIDHARFAALLAARDINAAIKKLDFEPDELGNFVAIVQSEE